MSFERMAFDNKSLVDEFSGYHIILSYYIHILEYFKL